MRAKDFMSAIFDIDANSDFSNHPIEALAFHEMKMTIYAYYHCISFLSLLMDSLE